MASRKALRWAAMTFRSDDDALRIKNEALQEDLSEARRELEEARPRIARVDELEQELEAARKQLLDLRSPRHGRRVPAIAAVAGVFVAVVCLAGGLLFALTSSQQKAEAELAAVASRRVEMERAERAAMEARRRAEEARAREEARRVAAEAARGPFAERTGRVTHVEGPAPAVEGGECSITVERATGTRFDARLHVMCGGRTVYGRPGFGHLSCTMRHGRPERCEDRVGSRDNGDPMVVLDLPTGTVVVSDGPELPWTVRVDLDEPPE